jgi:methyl-accepting chemotaxis protein
MKIGQKLLLGAVALTLVPLVITALALTQGATTIAANTVNEQVQTQLSALRDQKAQEVKGDVQNKLAALQALGRNQTTIEAMASLKPAFYSAAAELAKSHSSATQRQGMLNYVDQQFNAEFIKRNPAAAPSLVDIIDKRDPNMAALQHEYIVVNPNALGEKEKLVATANRFAYSTLHEALHPSMEAAQKLFGFYDIFLIDTNTDTVVYTVFKELDFGSRLTTGIAARTKLAEAYYKAKHAKNAQDVYLSDFEPYLPSYNDQAAFAAVPVFDGERQIGVLAIQYPIDKITAVMSSNKSWSKIGLGETGDSFLVGSDFLMRSEARYLAEDSSRAAFVKQLSASLDGSKQALMDKKKTTIGLVKVESDATRAAQAGKSGVVRFTDYRGVPSIGAFAPLQVQGLNWAIVTKIDAEEADAPVSALSQATLLRAVLVAVLVLGAVAALMSLFLRHFMKPISTLHGAVQAVAGGDTAARSQLKEADEIGELGRAFDQLLDDRLAALAKAQAENETLNNSVIGLLQTVFQLSNKDLTVRAAVTEDVIGTLSSSINQLSDETGRTLSDVKRIADEVRAASESVSHQATQVDTTAQHERQALEHMAQQLERATKQLSQVSKLTDSSSRTAEQASSATDAALRTVAATVRGMDELRESISDAEKRFKRLGERSQEISSVVSLINTISERTHVLALNASMQAATAGEAGRGFAVVAEEVQRLSESSRQATQQIAQLVQNIQLETNETIFTMNRLIGSVVTQSEQAQAAGEQMTQTQQTTAELVGMVKQIATYSDQQSLLSRELQLAVAKLNKGSIATVAAISTQATSTQSLAQSSRKLIDAVSQFTLPAPVASNAAHMQLDQIAA